MNSQVNAVASAADAHQLQAEGELADDLAINAYANAERTFIALLKSPNLDGQARGWSAPLRAFEQALCEAPNVAYDELSTARDAAHLFLQRVLYRIYRLNLFWYDELASYTNERSVYLHELRARIEAAWQPWERAQLRAIGRDADIARALIERAEADLDPPYSADDYFFRDQMTLEGYRHLLAIASLDGLVEASQLSRILGGAANPVHARLTRLLLEEYGFGHLERKHSSYFTTMLQAANMRTEPEYYLDLVPWEVLALTNQSFLFSEQRRYFLRYIGGLLYFETSVPAAFRHYQAAAKRLGIAEDGRAYWDLHIHADERHGRWMLNDVALPLAGKYRQDAWQLVYGYDQQRSMSARAGKAVARAVREAQSQRGTR
ncbi:MAG: iron-containing redox enzyme family protein [Gammaproteobacteria bacterium]